MNKLKCIVSTVLILSTVLSLSGASLVFATETNIDDLQDQIGVRKSQIDQINSKIDEYREKVNQYASQSASLQSDISMIENQVVLTELDIQATQIEIESQGLQLQIIEESIAQQEVQIQMQKEMLKEMIFELNKSDGVGFIEVLFSSNDFNDLFTEIELLETLNADIQNALEQTKETKLALEENKADLQDRLDQLVDLQDELEGQKLTLESQMEAKDVLLDYTEQSESQYRVLLSQMRQEQQNITQQISALQLQMDDMVSGSDDYVGETVFSWPLNGIITATFHDPTYPFRNIIGEHNGLDIAAPAGTPIRAAAPGYVAWARYGNSYGNYVMIIHANGYATLYAHMSSMVVSADQYVSRGDIIGYEGTTGFSTGPHLHFEVRENGIPVDPQLYLGN
ncbi:MAG: Peptidase, M23/M37 family [Candidatus Uhrbacteria bacterium GW2011_GWD2_41_121]|uniref:Peptidase, M23/M37 family n=1 Tax=Candidatus Uhrbacteria bacterium GW2011_GWC1_41_20 TaxID=1618983 RepID=A0A0G0XSC9_9BACT|nr:MAG: Peptidase, M23/M37 family [Candidatus Uhrbacteria bacterium GW2011_GWE1_39_46]KKR64535.1 MAG: Peptidase, M23/M37 family [Candidatus Uhrbacteria bacterium GW2011_GWC2_40_450]KKR90100.1 MAG: Peptidase, M23/M37 family [Candidatus Uhrbacteria bacterium GW2011_GWE2_41_1153]KKR90607.1 MAG: Peptidase, M23/M37 family [Candidatus Uhrbacteria bacterium GW2011_GWD2_41_121]KKR96518.1 MAG: Peptidase, M23/M37 family [Candidatus Uhrbacteria bacterium GW2011_GWD1_41_16]KKR99870.1 MAG: Peptidase, M23/M